MQSIDRSHNQIDSYGVAKVLFVFVRNDVRNDVRIGAGVVGVVGDIREQ